MTNPIQIEIQAGLDQNVPPQEIRLLMQQHPFKEWASAYLRCTRKVPILAPWNEGNDAETTAITQILRGIAMREGQGPQQAFFTVYEIMHGVPHPEA